MKFDAVVIGSGPNGLTSAITLAEAGRSVVVLEEADHVGGACRSQELTLPGFIHDIGAAVMPWGHDSPAWRDLPLHRHGLEWDDARLAALDLQYHDLRPEKSVFNRLGMQRLVNDDEVVKGMVDPPTDTRAYFRGECLKRWAPEIVAANWDSMVFDVGQEPLRRVPMMEPARGTEAHVGKLIRDCDTARELLDALGA